MLVVAGSMADVGRRSVLLDNNAVAVKRAGTDDLGSGDELDCLGRGVRRHLLRVVVRDRFGGPWPTVRVRRLV